MSVAQDPWETRAVLGRLPDGAQLIAACWHPVPGRALRMSPDDVEALTHEQVRRRLPPGKHLVMSLRPADMEGEQDGGVTALLEATDGGVLVVGVSYELASAAKATHDQTCPECGARDADVLGPADGHVAPGQRGMAQLFQCPECDSAWDG